MKLQGLRVSSAAGPTTRVGRLMGPLQLCCLSPEADRPLRVGPEAGWGLGPRGLGTHLQPPTPTINRLSDKLARDRRCPQRVEAQLSEATASAVEEYRPHTPRATRLLPAARMKPIVSAVQAWSW